MADPAVLAAAWKSAMGEKGSFSHAPWYDLVRATAVKSIDVSHALFEITAEAAAEIDLRTNWLDPAAHPGWAFNIGAFWDKQMAEVAAVLAAHKAQGFGVLVLRDLTYDEREKRMRHLDNIWKETGDRELIGKAAKKIKKAEREGFEIVAIVEPDGRTKFFLYERKPEAPAKKKGEATAPAEDTGDTVTKAFAGLVETAQRSAIARIMPTVSIEMVDLIAVLTLLLAHRIGMHAMPEGLVLSGGNITLEQEHIIRGARHVIAKAATSEAIPLDHVHRVGALLCAPVSLPVTADGLSALKRPALEEVYRACTGEPMPAQGTMKAIRQALVDKHGEGGELVLTPATLGLLTYIPKPLGWTPGTDEARNDDSDYDPETGEIANDNEPAEEEAA
jgi:hypothetical protein